MALLRWGLITVLDIASTYGYDDPYIPAWTDTLNRYAIRHLLIPLVPRFYTSLTAYPTDPDWGYNIALDVPLNVSHRHFSHLFMVWPLQLQDLTIQSELALAMTSVDHWLSLSSELTGFARPAASSMNTHFAAALTGEASESRKTVCCYFY